MKNYLLILAILLGLVSCQFRPVAELRFHENGRFKIVQFTDLHWAPGLPSSAQTTATIQHLLQTEKPDLAVLTGDVVTATPAEAGWTAIVDLFDKARVPFTVVMGNHDAEQQVTRRQIYQWLARSPNTPKCWAKIPRSATATGENPGFPPPSTPVYSAR